MHLDSTIYSKGITFVRVPLEFVNKPKQDLFGDKNNKSVSETLEHKRYQKLKDQVIKEFPHSKDKALGSFLISLKRKRNPLYRSFLNKYGDRSYSDFSISDPEFLEKKGIYAYYSGRRLKYIGRCKDSLKKRINSGYGRITPKNCYIDG